MGEISPFTLEGGDVQPGFSWIITPYVGATILSLAGDLDLAAEVEMRHCMAEAISGAEPPRVVIDLKSVSFCDSTGLSALLTALSGAEAAGGVLVLSEVHPRIRRVLAITGLHRRFTSYGTVEEAIAALPRPVASEVL